MNYSGEITMLQERIEQLTHLKEILFQIDETVCSIEKEVSDIDNALPNPKRMTDIKDPVEREQLSHAETLLKEAYALIDEILGTPEDEATGAPAGTAFSPEARGTSDAGGSIEDFLAKFGASKNHTS